MPAYRKMSNCPAASRAALRRRLRHPFYEACPAGTDKAAAGRKKATSGAESRPRNRPAGDSFAFSLTGFCATPTDGAHQYFCMTYPR